MNEKLHEINGKKFLIKNDPTMELVEEYRVGDQVMVLKKSYGDSFKMYPGVIIGFHDFQSLPTVHIAYLDVEYSAANVEFIAFNANTKDQEFTRYVGNDLPYGKDRVLTLLAGEITKKENELREAQHKLAYFNECFGRYFSESTSGATKG